MTTATLDDSRWIDIQPINLLPSDSGYSLLLFLVLLVISTLVLLYLWRQPQRHLRRQLNHLNSQVKPANNRRLLLHTQHLLREFFAVHHLSQWPHPDPRWPVFYQHLLTACYQASEPSDDLTRQLIAEAQRFSRREPPPC